MFEMSYNKQNFQTVLSNTISNHLNTCNFNKAPGKDDVSGRFSNNGVDVLTIPLKRPVIYPSNYLAFQKAVN